MSANSVTTSSVSSSYRVLRVGIFPRERRKGDRVMVGWGRISKRHQHAELLLSSALIGFLRSNRGRGMVGTATSASFECLLRAGVSADLCMSTFRASISMVYPHPLPKPLYVCLLFSLMSTAQARSPCNKSHSLAPHKSAPLVTIRCCASVRCSMGPLGGISLSCSAGAPAAAEPA